MRLPKWLAVGVLLICWLGGFVGLERGAFAQMGLPNLTQQKSLLKSSTGGLIQRASLGFAWTPSMDAAGLELIETNVSFTSALPLPIPLLREHTKMTLLSVSPNFRYTHVQWNGDGQGEGFLPESLYAGGVTVGLMSIVNERRRVIVNAMPAYSSDGKATSRSFVCPVMAALNCTYNERWNLTVGIIYLDRSDIPVLPVGGAIYTPNENTRLELMMPQLKFAKRFLSRTTLHADNVADNASAASPTVPPTNDNWWFLSGGFSGNSWAFRSVGDQDDFAMLREYVLKCGWEHTRPSTKWTLELGYLFGREIQFDRKTQNNLKPSDSLNLRLLLAL